MISAMMTYDLGHYERSRYLYAPRTCLTLPQTSTPRHRHAAALVERHATYLRIDGAHAGVGGVDSWGALPLPEHQLAVGATCKWRFAMRPFDGNDPPPHAIAVQLRCDFASQLPQTEC